jgi:hypothetical protein
MVDADRLNANDLDGHDFSAAMEALEGELNAAVDWVDDAFGEIEREAGRLAPVRFFKAIARAVARPR